MLPDFERSFLKPSRIQQPQTMIGIERPESRIKRCLWFDAAPIMFKDARLLNLVADCVFACGEKKVGFSGNDGKRRPQLPAFHNLLG